MKFFVFSNKSFLLLSFLSYEILGTTNFQRTILYATVGWTGGEVEKFHGNQRHLAPQRWKLRY